MTAPQDIAGTLAGALSAYTDAQSAAVDTANQIAAEREAPVVEGETTAPDGE